MHFDQHPSKRGKSMLVAIAAAASSALTVAFLVGALESSNHATLRTERLEITRSDGKTVLVLSADPKHGYVQVVDARGDSLLSIGVDPYSGAGLILVRNTRGEGVCKIGADSNQQYGRVDVWDYAFDRRAILEPTSPQKRWD
jgi:hypothetical protein